MKRVNQVSEKTSSQVVYQNQKYLNQKVHLFSQNDKQVTIYLFIVDNVKTYLQQ